MKLDKKNKQKYLVMDPKDPILKDFKENGLTISTRTGTIDGSNIRQHAITWHEFDENKKLDLQKLWNDFLKNKNITQEEIFTTQQHQNLWKEFNGNILSQLQNEHLKPHRILEENGKKNAYFGTYIKKGYRVRPFATGSGLIHAYILEDKIFSKISSIQYSNFGEKGIYTDGTKNKIDFKINYVFYEIFGNRYVQDKTTFFAAQNPSKITAFNEVMIHPIYEEYKFGKEYVQQHVRGIVLNLPLLDAFDYDLNKLWAIHDEKRTNSKVGSIGNQLEKIANVIDQEIFQIYAYDYTVGELVKLNPIALKKSIELFQKNKDRACPTEWQTMKKEFHENLKLAIPQKPDEVEKGHNVAEVSDPRGNINMEHSLVTINSNNFKKNSFFSCAFKLK